MNTEGGFCFNFDSYDSSSVETQASHNPTETLSSLLVFPKPKIPLSDFPWITFCSPEWTAWLSRYTSATLHSSSQSSCTTSLTLMVSSVVSSHVYSLKYQTAPEIDAITCMPNTSTLNEKHSDRRDIIPGKYYGGLKVWSCAPYLAQFLLEHETEYRPIFSKTDSHKKSCSTVVAEVGCGHALPGLAALCLGASHVILQDYNAEVLDACTGPNVAATVNSNPHFFATFSDTQPSKLSYPSVKLVHGDWVDFRCDDHCDKCDVILGSDVTFDVEACQKLVCLLQRWLKPDGFALIASKEYYFGTNGGRLEFVAIASQHGIKVEILDELKDGGSMNRVILKVFAGPSLIND